MPCKDCNCEAMKTELIADGHDKYGTCRNPTCGHPVLNHTDASAVGYSSPLKRSSTQSEPPSGGSKSRRQRDEVGKLIELLEDARECKVDVILNRVTLEHNTDPNILVQLLSARGNNLSKIESLLGIDHGKFDESKFPKMDLKRLQQASESAVQQSLNASLFSGPYDAVDSHKKVIGPNAKIAQKMYDTDEKIVEAVYSFTGRPDAMGFGIDLEIKAKRSNPESGQEEDILSPDEVLPTDQPDVQTIRATATEYQVLQQALERVLVRAVLAGHIKRWVVLAATGKNCWALIFERKFACKDPIGTIHILPIQYEDANTIWGKWTQFVNQDTQTAILTLDGAHIQSALRDLGHDAAYCRVKFGCQSSQSRVYFISFPKMYKTFSGYRIRGVAGQSDIALKIVAERAAYDTELQVFTDLSLQYEKEGCHEDFYVMSPEKKVSCPEFPIVENSWWGRMPDIRGNTIMMKVGKTVSNFTASTTIDQILHSLRRLHAAGWLHCDIRRPNFLEFGGKVQLIDFGVARRLRHDAALVEVDLDKLGPHVRKLVSLGQHTPIIWTEADDYEMLFMMLARMVRDD